MRGAPAARRLVPAAAVALGLALAGCGVPDESSPRFREDGDIPFGLHERPETTTTAATPAPVPSVSCFVNGENEIVVRQAGAAGAPLIDRLRAVPDPASGTAVSTAVPDPEIVASTSVRGGVADIDLRPDFADLPVTTQRTIAAQLVCTATATPGVGQVRFTLDGTPLSVPRGDGSLTAERLTLDDYTELLDT